MNKIRTLLIGTTLVGLLSLPIVTLAQDTVDNSAVTFCSVSGEAINSPGAADNIGDYINSVLDLMASPEKPDKVAYGFLNSTEYAHEVYAEAVKYLADQGFTNPQAFICDITNWMVNNAGLSGGGSVTGQLDGHNYALPTCTGLPAEEDIVLPPGETLDGYYMVLPQSFIDYMVGTTLENGMTGLELLKNASVQGTGSGTGREVMTQALEEIYFSSTAVVTDPTEENSGYVVWGIPADQLAGFTSQQLFSYLQMQGFLDEDLTYDEYQAVLSSLNSDDYALVTNGNDCFPTADCNGTQYVFFYASPDFEFGGAENHGSLESWTVL